MLTGRVKGSGGTKGPEGRRRYGVWRRGKDRGAEFYCCKVLNKETTYTRGLGGEDEVIEEVRQRRKTAGEKKDS